MRIDLIGFAHVQVDSNDLGETFCNTRASDSETLFFRDFGIVFFKFIGDKRMQI